MACNVGRQPLTPVSLNQQPHGHKRKMDLEQDEKRDLERCIRGVNLNAIEQIADRVERMMFMWNLDTFKRGQERAKILNSSTTLDNIPSGHNSDVKENKACTICHKLASQQVTTKVTACNRDQVSCTRNPAAFETQHRTNVCSSICYGTPQFDHDQNLYTNNSETGNNKSTVDISQACRVPGGVPSVVIHQNQMTGGDTVLEIRRDPAGTFQISTSKKVGTEGICFEHPQAMVLNSPRHSLWGPTPSPPAETLPPTPPSQRDCYPVQEDSCPFDLPGVFTGERHLHVSPRKDETTHACHTAHLCPNVAFGNKAHDCKHDRAYNGGVFEYCGPHCDFCSPHVTPRQTRGSAMQLEIEIAITKMSRYVGEGGRVVTVPMLRNSPEDLANKFESLIHMTSSALPFLNKGNKELRSYSLPREISSMEELQLAMIECATEYEIKTLDARVNMHKLRAQKIHKSRMQKRLTASSEFDQLVDSQENQNHDETPTSNVAKRLKPQIAQQYMKKHVMKPEEMKESMKRPLDPQPWKKKERSIVELQKSKSGTQAFSRLYDNQRRNLDDALHRIDRLQREVVKKDQEVVEWQLKEKETKAQLHELEDRMKKSLVLHTSPRWQPSLRLKPRKPLMEIPSLCDALGYNSLKEEEQTKISNLPRAETVQDNVDKKSMSEMSDQDGSFNSRLQFIEERASEMDDLKVTMSKLASNMAELSMAFKDHVQFVNHQLAAIHGFVKNKKLSPRPQVVALETVGAQKEIMKSPRSSRSSAPSWQR